MAQSSWSTG